MPSFSFESLFASVFGFIGQAFNAIFGTIIYYSPLPDLYDIIILIIIGIFILYKIYQKLFAQE